MTNSMEQNTLANTSFMNQEVYYVCCAEYEPTANFHGEIYTLRKSFYEAFQRPVKINNVSEYMGFKSKTRGIHKRKSIKFKKIVDDIHMEEAFRFGKSFVVLRRDLNNNICGKIHYDENMKWIKTEYFEFDDLKNAVVILKPSTRADIIEKFTYNPMSKNYTSENLHPVPYDAGSAKQSFENSKNGKPYVLSATNRGEFCYCSEEESKKRLESAEEFESTDMQNEVDFSQEKTEIAEVEVLEVSQVDEMDLEQIEDLPEEFVGEDESEEIGLEEEDFDLSGESLEEYYEYMIEDSVISDEDLMLEIERNKEPEIEVLEEEEEEEVETHEEEIHYAKNDDLPPSPPALNAEEVSGDRENSDKEHVIFVSGKEYLYSGSLKNGKREGRGRTSQINGNTAFDGEYNDGKKDGFGASYNKSGHLSYVGYWSSDTKNGAGVSFRESDNAMHITRWQNGKPSKRVSLFDSSGDLRYVGNMTGGKKDGFGLSLKPDNSSVFVGRYDSDQISFGALFDGNGNLVYNGHWKNGKRHGFGTEFDKNGEIIYSGQWKEDKYFSGTLYKKIDG